MEKNASEAFEFRSARRAVEVIDAATRTRTLADVCDEIGVTRQAVASWRANPDAVLKAPHARAIRRLHRRSGK